MTICQYGDECCRSRRPRETRHVTDTVRLLPVDEREMVMQGGHDQKNGDISRGSLPDSMSIVTVGRNATWQRMSFRAARRRGIHNRRRLDRSRGCKHNWWCQHHCWHHQFPEQTILRSSVEATRRTKDDFQSREDCIRRVLPQFSPIGGAGLRSRLPRNDWNVSRGGFVVRPNSLGLEVDAGANPRNPASIRAFRKNHD
jgi:hypothetical protein